MICPACQAPNDIQAEACFSCGRVLSALTRGALLAGRYEIVDVLGRGGMGVVYKAFDQVLDELVAIKVLRRDLTTAEAQAQRFRSEIKLARRVSHPNVCRIHDYGQEGALHYVTMAFIEGHDLRCLLAQHPAGLPSAAAYDIALQVARGLQAIHEVGIIHRDLKPSNIMRDARGHVHLMDFGIAKELGPGNPHSVTASGSVMGTPEYMSPEQCRDEGLDARSDIYALGVLLFELFTGRVPFRGDSPVATLFKHIQEAPPLAGPLAAHLPGGLVPILQRALAKTRTERFATAADVFHALDGVRSLPGPLSAPTAHLPVPRERRAHTRLETPLNVRLRRLDSRHGTVQEERTIADNISRQGMRVMTAMAGVQVGECLEMQELDGDFHALARVRHVTPGADHILRVGLEFIDCQAPDRLVRTENWNSRLACESTPDDAGFALARERRISTRLSIPLDVVLSRLDAGRVVEQERTFTENISHGGARVMTTLHAVTTGDVVLLAEVGGDFRARAVVRHTYYGNDRVKRLNLEFIEQVGRLIPLPTPCDRRPGDVPAGAAATSPGTGTGC